MNSKKKLLKILKENAYKEGEFILSSGKKSDFFLDCKTVSFQGKWSSLIGEILFDEAIKNPLANGVLSIAAVPLGGCPLATSLAIYAAEKSINLKILYVRDQSKTHGTRQSIEGYQNVNPGEKVILLEDVVTTGFSAIRSAQILKENDFKVAYILCLIDRKEGAKENISSAGFDLFSIYSIDDFKYQ